MILRSWFARLVLLGTLVLAAAPALAQSVEMRAAGHEGFGRMVFEWSEPTGYAARIEGNRLIVTFSHPVTADPAALVPRLRAYVTAAHLENNGQRVVFDLAGKFTLRPRAFGSSVVIDLVGSAAAAPAAPPSAAAPAEAGTPLVPVKVGIHPTFTRLVFDWPKRVGFSVAADNGRNQVRFDAPGRIDLARLRAELPDAFKAAAEDSRAPLAVSLPSFGAAKSFRASNGRAVVVDLPVSGAAAAAPAAPQAAEKSAEKPAAKSAAKSAPAAVPEADAAKPAGGRVVSLSFPWDQPTGAAVFRRAGYVWVVFDRPHTVDINLLRRMGQGVVDEIEQVPNGRGTAVRMIVKPGYNPSLRREGLLWIVDLMVQPLRPLHPIDIAAQPNAAGGPRLFLTVNEGGATVPVVDPEVGDTMRVVPVIPLGYGISPERDYVDASLPVTAQGVVVLPRADDLTVGSNRTGIEISRKGGLHLSGDATAALATAVGDDAPPIGQVFDMKRWVRGGEDHFVEDRRALMAAVVDASDDRRNAARMELARFYFAHGYAAEALGVLRTIQAADPAQENDPAFRAVRGGANFLMYRYDDALNDLNQESLDGSTEAQFWRALAHIAKDAAPAPDDILKVRAAAPVIRDYPPRLRTRMALVAAEALADAKDDAGVRNFLDVAKRDDNSIQEKAEISYLTGRLDALTGALDAAVEEWKKTEDTLVRPFRARAAFDRILLMHKMGKLSDNEAIDGLDRLRFAWRGDEYEYTLLKTLAEMELSAKRYGDGLRVLKQMVSYFPNSPHVKELTELMRTTFRELYLKDRANDMPPVRAIALFEEFRELTPPGDEGDEMIRKLADRLVDVDLLDQAATLLDRQVDTRLQGVEKSRVGARLALVYLLNKQPGLALAALKKSDTPNLPPDLARQRNHLLARALADLGQTDKALQSLATDGSDDAYLLKAEILWRDKNWAGAAEALSHTVHPPAPGSQMSPAMRQRVLQWATALRLSEQRREIALVRRDYLAYMNSTPEFDAFNLLTNRTSPGLIDMAAVEAQIKQAENFRSFMGEYKNRMKSGGLSGIN